MIFIVVTGDLEYDKESVKLKVWMRGGDVTQYPYTAVSDNGDIWLFAERPEDITIMCDKGYIGTSTTPELRAKCKQFSKEWKFLNVL